MVPMRNLLNDAYCRDISVKIKSQLAVKRKRGDFVGSFATYGYQKDPGNHTKARRSCRLCAISRRRCRSRNWSRHIE